MNCLIPKLTMKFSNQKASEKEVWSNELTIMTKIADAAA